MAQGEYRTARWQLAVALLSIGLTAQMGWSSTITGDPATDSGWTAGGNSLAFGTYASGSEQNSVNIYTTTFTLGASSPLVGLPGNATDTSSWKAGDVIVGIGGLVVNTNFAAGGWAVAGDPHSAYTSGSGNHTVNQEISDGGQRIVVKYGSGSTAWTTSPINDPPAAGPGTGNVSMTQGGVGGVLLGTYSLPASDSGLFEVPDDGSAIQTGASSTSSVDGYEGRVIEDWSGGALVGFESFLDLTLLQAQYPATTVALGNKFDLDIQDGSGNFTNAQGNLPASSLTVPTPAAFGAGIALLGIVGVARRSRK